MGKLRFDGVNDIVQVPNAAPFTAGMAYVFEWEGTINAFPSSGLTGIIGTITGSNSNGVVMHASEGSGGCRFYAAGASVYGSGAGFIQVGVNNVYRLEHDVSGSGGQYRWKRNGVTISSGTYTGSGSVQKLDQFGRSSGTSASYLNADIEKFYVNAGGFETTWDANLSGGTGSVLPSVGGSNNGTLVNFPTDNTQWIGFGGVDAAADLLKSTVTLIAKTVQASADASVNTTKSTVQLFGKALSVEGSANVDLIKSTVQLNSKTIISVADGNADLSKSIVEIVAKQLVGDTSAAVNAEVDLLKSTVSIVGKSLTVSADANVNLSKSLVNIIGKQLGLTNDAIVSLSKSTVQLNGKVLVGNTSASVDAIVDLIKGTVTLSGKSLVASADAQADLNRSVVQMSAKMLTVAADAQIDLSKGVVQMTAKFLSVGDVAYSLPADRIFLIPVDNVIFNIPVDQYVFTIQRG